MHVLVIINGVEMEYYNGIESKAHAALKTPNFRRQIIGDDEAQTLFETEHHDEQGTSLVQLQGALAHP